VFSYVECVLLFRADRPPYAQALWPLYRMCSLVELIRRRRSACEHGKHFGLYVECVLLLSNIGWVEVGGFMGAGGQVREPLGSDAGKRCKRQREVRVRRKRRGAGKGGSRTHVSTSSTQRPLHTHTHNTKHTHVRARRAAAIATVEVCAAAAPRDTLRDVSFLLFFYGTLALPVSSVFFKNLNKIRH